MFTRARHLFVSWATCIYSMLTYPISPSTSPNNIFPSTATSSNWSLPSAFPHQNPVFSSIPCVPHYRPISIPLFLSNNMICWRVKKHGPPHYVTFSSLLLLPLPYIFFCIIFSNTFNLGSFSMWYKFHAYAKLQLCIFWSVYAEETCLALKYCQRILWQLLLASLFEHEVQAVHIFHPTYESLNHQLLYSSETLPTHFSNSSIAPQIQPLCSTTVLTLHPDTIFPILFPVTKWEWWCCLRKIIQFNSTFILCISPQHFAYSFCIHRHFLLYFL